MIRCFKDYLDYCTICWSRISIPILLHLCCIVTLEARDQAQPLQKLYKLYLKYLVLLIATYGVRTNLLA